MPKASALPYLNLNASKNNGEFNGLTPATLSPRSAGSPRSPGSAPSSPYLQGSLSPSMIHHISAVDDRDDSHQMAPTSPRITAMPEFPPSPAPPLSPKHGRDASKGFFSNLIASKSSHKLHSSEGAIPEAVERPNPRSRANSKDRNLHAVKKQGSTPDLARYPQGNVTLNGHPQTSHSEVTGLQSSGEPVQTRKGKSKLGGILSRTKTLKVEDSPPRQKGPSHLQIDPTPPPHEPIEPSPKTAPIRADFRERALMSENGATLRNHSVDRQPREDSHSRRERQAAALPMSQSFRDGSIFSNFGQTGKGMGDRLGKAGKGFFGKITRSGSSNERDHLTDDNYTCTTINLPLVKQTRKTRIARRLELSKDKTEFWMPALPWRCIE